MNQWIRDGLTCNLPEGDGFPCLIPVRQLVEEEEVADLGAATRGAMEQLNLEQRLSPGDRVLIAAGSRGIRDIVRLLDLICDYLRDMQVEPVILGAMGSHGGGTPEGQEKVLASLGITEERLGARVITSNCAEVVGRDEAGRDVYCDPLVFEYDGLLAVNRVKAHTTIRGDIQSGILKMLVVGLGHQQGAEALHRNPPAQLSEALVQMGTLLAEKTPFLGGVGIVENASKRSAVITGLNPEALEEQEKRMLERAQELLPTLPFSRADVLVIQRMGKDFSGTGMDTNVIGRLRIEGTVSPGNPEIGSIAVLDLTEASHGNACGLGLADFITARLAAKIDLQATYLNVFTSRLTMRAMIPMIVKTDRDAVAAGIITSGVKDPRDLRLAVISDTLHLDTLWVTPALWEDICDRSGVDRAGPEIPLEFDEQGSLLIG